MLLSLYKRATLKAKGVSKMKFMVGDSKVMVFNTTDITLPGWKTRIYLKGVCVTSVDDELAMTYTICSDDNGEYLLTENERWQFWIKGLPEGERIPCISIEGWDQNRDILLERFWPDDDIVSAEEALEYLESVIPEQG